MKLFLGLSGFIITMLGVILALHFDFTIGLIATFFGLFMFWGMLPSTEQNQYRQEQLNKSFERSKNNEQL